MNSAGMPVARNVSWYMLGRLGYCNSLISIYISIYWDTVIDLIYIIYLVMTVWHDHLNHFDSDWSREQQMRCDMIIWMPMNLLRGMPRNEGVESAELMRWIGHGRTGEERLEQPIDDCSCDVQGARSALSVWLFKEMAYFVSTWNRWDRPVSSHIRLTTSSMQLHEETIQQTEKSFWFHYPTQWRNQKKS